MSLFRRKTNNSHLSLSFYLAEELKKKEHLSLREKAVNSKRIEALRFVRDSNFSAKILPLKPRQPLKGAKIGLLRFERPAAVYDEGEKRTKLKESDGYYSPLSADSPVAKIDIAQNE